MPLNQISPVGAPPGTTERTGFSSGFGGGGMPGGGGGGVSGGGDAAGMLPRILQLPLPWVVPIPGSTEFNTLGTHDTAAVENAVEVTDAGFKLPVGYVGWINGVIFYVNNIIATSNLQFTVAVNGGSVAGYAPITIFPRVAASVSNAFDSKIALPNGAKVQVFFSNLDGGAYKVGAGLSGWFWSETAGRAWTQYGAGAGL